MAPRSSSGQGSETPDMEQTLHATVFSMPTAEMRSGKLSSAPTCANTDELLFDWKGKF
jgi:hypothetical protein